MENIFEQQDLLRSLIPSYEKRAEQEQMSSFIGLCLEENSHGLVEAGTGTGKTLAYLIPALIHTMATGTRVLISTETKTLQKQLMDKDIPLAQRIIEAAGGGRFRHALCLGSNNYVCRRRFEILLERGAFNPEEQDTVDSLMERLRGGNVFSRFDIQVAGGLWSRICREPEGCASGECPFNMRCPYMKARKEWNRATVLVMNHYLYFSNIAAGRSLLPQCEYAILDEAHSLEEVASSQLGFSLSAKDLADTMERFFRKRKDCLLNHVSSTELEAKGRLLAKRIETRAGEFFESLRSLFRGNSLTERIRRPLTEGRDLVSVMKDFLVLMAEAEGDFDAERLKQEYDIARGRLAAMAEILERCAADDGREGYVCWIERREGELLGDVTLRGQPVDVSDIMRREVFSFHDAALLVSATLSVRGDFSYITGRLGLDVYRSQSLASPFDFSRSAVLYLDKTLPDPGTDTFISKAAPLVARIVDIVGGNCLVLFTSYRSMVEMKRALRRILSCEVISQDENPAGEALEMYLNTENSVLLGTHSFWQGIDLPGDLLRGIVVMRLPFSVPDSPPIQARSEMVESRGGNPFALLQIPEAVIRFRQGFGRLIRTASDRGVIAVLDPRVLSKSYGRIFLSSIPRTPVVYGLNELEARYRTLLMDDGTGGKGIDGDRSRDEGGS